MNALGVLVKWEIEMFKLASKSRQRKCVLFTVLVGSVLLQDEAKGDSQMPVVINMDGADQRLPERQMQRQLIDEQVS